MRRIGQKFWNEIPWEKAAIARDDEFRMLEAGDIEAATGASLAPIDDLAVVVQFSVKGTRQEYAAGVRPPAPSRGLASSPE